MAADDFPGLPQPGDATFAEVDADVIATLISLTQYSMSSDDTRPHLAGALFQGDGKVVRMVTTDGHRLSKAERAHGSDASLDFSMLVPNKGIQELKRLIEDSKGGKGDDGKVTIGIATKGGNAFFRRDGIQLSVKLADEAFPPYSKVIPQSQNREVVIARAPLVDALRRIALVASDKSGGVRLHIEAGTMRLTSENPDVGEGSEEVDVDYAGDPLVIGFNARYVLDVLSALTSDEVVFRLSGELDPGVIQPVSDMDGFVGVIMPMRI
jgi:DNA polymerase-3 subunit beta